MKKIFFAVLFAAACGGTQKQSADASASSDLVAECTYSLPETASADEVQQVIADAESGALDVCGDQVSASLKSAGLHATLESIDPDEADHRILVRFQMWKGREPLSTP